MNSNHGRLPMKHVSFLHIDKEIIPRPPQSPTDTQICERDAKDGRFEEKTRLTRSTIPTLTLYDLSQPHLPTSHQLFLLPTLLARRRLMPHLNVDLARVSHVVAVKCGKRSG